METPKPPEVKPTVVAVMDSDDKIAAIRGAKTRGEALERVKAALAAYANGDWRRSAATAAFNEWSKSHANGSGDGRSA